MTNLAKYNGNFIHYLDSEFIDIGTGKEYRFPHAVKVLDIKAHCRVAVLPSENQESSVYIDAENQNDFKVWVNGDRLCIEQNGNAGNTVVSTVPGNMSMINGQIFFNGVPINQVNQSPPKKPAQILIRCPKQVRLFAELDGVSVLASKIVFSKANISLSGQGTIGIATKGLKLNLSGQGKSYVVMQEGELDINLAGQGNLQVKGVWDEADVSLSGMGSIFTEGVCLGDYSARVSGMGNIRHRGEIKGQARKSESGMGSCSLG